MSVSGMQSKVQRPNQPAESQTPVGQDRQGREVTREQKPWLSDRTKKIIAIVSIVFLLCGVFIPIYPVMSAPLHQVSESANGECGATLPPLCSSPSVVHFNSNGPIQQFPAYVARVPFAGLMTGKGSDLCLIPSQKMVSFEECEAFAAALHKRFQQEAPDFYRETMRRSDIKTQAGYEIATTLELDGFTLSRASVGTDERKIVNYKEALLYVQENILQNLSIFEGEARDIVDVIKQTNALLCRELVKNPGVFRDERSLIQDGTQGEGETLRDTLKKKGGTYQDLTNFDSVMRKVEKYDTFEEAFSEITASEIDTLSKIGYLTCPSEEVGPKMFALAKQIQEIAKKVILREYDCVEAAAFVHREIGTIHPFEDGNGRTARIWMNAMLQLGGCRSVILPEEDKYMAAVIADQKSPGVFASYLREVIDWNNQQEVLVTSREPLQK